MIKANELMVGNWVQIDYSECLEYEQIGCIDNSNYESYYPIPLTPEILEKAGFKRNRNSKEWKHLKINNKEYISAFAGNDAWACWTYDRYYVGNAVQHLHQLQNLYFALTGAELEINL